MRPPPPLTNLGRCPVTVGVGALAVVTTVAWHGGGDIDLLFMDSRAWQGQPWRLVTSALPHVDALHLIFNLYWLWVFGAAVEGVFGHLRAAAIMLLFAAGSASAEFAFFRGGVGLSGVGYGLFGMLWILSARDVRFEDVVDRQTVVLFVAWFFACIALTINGTWAVANVAHATGAVQGLLLGAAITAGPKRRLDFAGLSALVVVMAVVLATVGRPFVNFSGGPGQELAQAGYRELGEGRNESAADHYARALQLDAGQSNWWYNYAIACQRLRRDRQATEAYRRAFKLEPDTANYRVALAAWLAFLAYQKQSAGGEEEASRLYQEALELNARDASSWFNLGIAYQKLGRRESALQAYERAAALKPDDAAIRAALQGLRPTAKQP